MSELIAEQWPLLGLATTAMTFNMYAIAADIGRYPMGMIVHKYKAIFEFVNYLVLLGVTIYVSYLYSWWFLVAFFLFPAVGQVFASIFGGWTQIVWLLGMPAFLIVEIVLLAM